MPENQPDSAPPGLDEFLSQEHPPTQSQVEQPLPIPGGGISPTHAVDTAPEGLNDFLGADASTGREATTGVEGIARGLTGGLSDAVFKGARDLAEKQDVINPDWIAPKMEDIAERAETPLGKASEYTGMGAGLMGSTGVPGLIGAGAKGATSLAGKGLAYAGLNASPKLAKIGAMALTGALESGAFQGTDEISKAMLGNQDGDPSTPVSNALSHMGAAGLLGLGVGSGVGLGGAGLKAISESKTAGKASQWLSDFANRWHYNASVGDLPAKLTGELTDFHTSTMNAADEVFGPNGLKAQGIKKLLPEMHPGIQSQNQEISNAIDDAVKDLGDDPHAKILQREGNKWLDIISNPTATSEDVFNAHQKLKQQLQEWSKFSKVSPPPIADRAFISTAKTLGHQIKENLEDPKVWGKAGSLQQGVNGAFTEFLPALQDFEKRFTSTQLGEKSIDPGKVATYANQLGKPNAEIKQDVMKNFIDAAEKYRKQIQDLHDKLGIENTIAPAPLNALKGTLNKALPAGAKAADFLYKKGLGQLTDPAISKMMGIKFGASIGGIPGAAVGYVGAHALAPTLEHVVGRPLRGGAEAAVSGTLRALGNGETKGLNKVVDYGNKVDSGGRKIKKAVSSLFKTGRQAAISTEISDKDKKRLSEWINGGGIQQDLTPNPDQSGQPQGYAAGGIVMPSDQDTDESDPIADHFPAQNIMLNAAKSRISNYLTSVKPIDNPNKLPFDPEPDTSGDERIYDNALGIAVSPLSILDKVKDGTVRAQDVKHFTSMYPELHQHLAKQITKEIMNSQLSDEKPDYVQRQAMSLFLGTPLDSTMTPQAIMAAQSAFIRPQSPQQSQGKPGGKKGTSALGKSNKTYQTASQSAESDRNGRD
jgi:hypothetical protein